MAFGHAQGGNMLAMNELVAQAAQRRINGLIQGETEVGRKELARTIHRMSPQAGMPFLTLDCAASTETIRTELFGLEMDPSTGTSELGLLERAEGGDVFLSEVGELESVVQADLMRLIETGQVVRRGGQDAHRVRVRFIASSSRDLELQARAGNFRLDLFSKLTGFILKI
jgi:DNA-binding NtrC family response regulator